MQTNPIYCGEAATIQSDFPDGCVDLVVTDPPYLANYRERQGRSLANDNNPQAVLPVFDVLYWVMRPDSYCISFYGWTALAQFADRWEQVGFRSVGHIVWPKPYVSKRSYAQYRHESALILAKGNPRKPANSIPDVQPWKYSGNRAHPIEKAVNVITPLIRCFSGPGDLVLDPFLGSGTTAVAAAQNGRRYSGIELEECNCRHAEVKLSRVACLEPQRV